MTDVARLGLEVTSKGVDEGTRKLDGLTNAARRAEAAANGVSSSTKNAGAAAAAASAGFTREAAASTAAARAMEIHTQAANQNLIASKQLLNQRRNLQFQLIDFGTSIASGMPMYMVFMQQGGQIAQIWGDHEGGVGRALKEAATMVGNLALRFAPLIAVVGAASAVIAGMQYEIREATGVAVSFGDVATAALEVVTNYIYDQLSPAINAIAPIFATAWDGVVAGVKWMGNGVVRSIQGLWEYIKFFAMAFPLMLISAAESAANGFISAIEGMVSRAMAGLNTLIDGVNALGSSEVGKKFAETLGLPTEMKRFNEDVDLGQVNIGGKGANAWIDRLRKDRDNSLSRINGSDPMGQFFDAVKVEAVAKAQERLANSTKKATDASRNEEDSYKRIVEGANGRIAALKAEQAGLGMTEEAALKLRYEQDLLNQAQQKGITLTFAQRAELGSLAGQMATTEIATKKAREAAEFAKSTTLGFVNDLRNGLRNGEGFWKSFGNAALNVLDRITDKLLNDVMDALFQVNGAGGGGGLGGGGFLSSLFGSLFSPQWRLASGGGIGMYADGTASARAGLAMVGEEGPELVRFKGGEKVIPNHQLRSATSGANDNRTQPTFNIDARTTIQASGNAVTDAELKRWAAKRDAEMPGQVRKIITDINLRRG